jgi:soluble cytochrome b562
MTVEKAQLMIRAAHDIGVKLDDYLEKAKADLAKVQGHQEALRDVIGKIEQHSKYIDKDLEEGKIDAAQAEIAKRYVQHCGGIARNLLVSREVTYQQLNGRVEALELSVRTTKSYSDMQYAMAERGHPGEVVADSVGKVEAISETAPEASSR